MTEIYIIPVTKEKLDSMPEDVRLFFVHIGHIRNELMMLQKLLLASQQYTMTDEIQISMRAYQSLMLTRHLGGKLWEAWQLFSTSYFKSKLYLNYEKRLDIIGQKAITALKKYFGQNELMKNVRNHYAFHYSREQISAALADLKEPIDLKIYLSEQSGNTYFQISETIVNIAMLDSIEKGDYETALRKLMEQVLR